METLQNSDYITFNDDGRRFLYHCDSAFIFDITDPIFDCFDSQIKRTKSKVEMDEANEIVFNSLKQLSDYVNMPKDSMDDKLSCIVLNVSGKCNLQCPYCFSQDKYGFKFHSMDLKTSMDAIKYMIESNTDSDNYTITFFGGEPLIEYRLINSIITKTKESYPNKTFFYSITTNGTIVNDEIIHMLKQEQISLLISLDGFKHVVDRNRPFKKSNDSSFDIIMKNSQILQENNIQFSYRATIVAGQNDLLSTIIFFEQQNIPYDIVFCFDTTNDNDRVFSQWDDINLGRLETQIDAAHSFFYSRLESNKIIWCETFKKYIYALHTRKRVIWPCGCGHTMISVTDNGNIFPCMNFAPIESTSIGNIYTGLETHKHKIFKSIPFYETKECATCQIRFICAGGCLSERYSFNSNLSHPNSLTCSLNKLLAYKALSAYQHIKAHYKNFLENI